jgi:SAM-dependent methyltransferase
MGTAAIQGELWGARARDWAEIQEPAWAAVFDRALDLAGVTRGVRLLDIGCGSGGALALARARGAEVAGLDAAEALVAIARSRLPDARIACGEMEELPFADASFDIVIGINAFQFAGDPARALAEARRVCRPGGTVFALIWGAPERCDVPRIVRTALGPFMPPSAPAPPLDEAMRQVGLAPAASGSFGATLAYPSAELALRAFLASGVATKISRQAGNETVRAALAAAIGPFVRPDGQVSLVNEFRWFRASP